MYNNIHIKSDLGNLSIIEAKNVGTTWGNFITYCSNLTAGAYLTLSGSIDGTLVITDTGKFVLSTRLSTAQGLLHFRNGRNDGLNFVGTSYLLNSDGTITYTSYSTTDNHPLGNNFKLRRID